MNADEARKQKAFAAEKQLASVRAAVIVFGALTYFVQDPAVQSRFALWLMPVIWLYGGIILFYRPYEKHPIFLTSWFTYTSDCLFTTLWVYATGGFHSPYYVIYFTSIVAVAYRFGLRTTLFTCSLYMVCYGLLVAQMGQLDGNMSELIVRCGFIYLLGLIGYLITRETLWQTQQKIQVERLMEESEQNRKELLQLNEELRLQNDLFNHAEQNANLGSYFLNLSTSQLEYSEHLFRLLDHEPGDFIPTIETYVKFLHPDDREEFRKLLDTLAESDGQQSVVHRVITGKGVLKYLRATAKIKREGSDTLVIGTLQDISNDVALNEELREKNSRLAEINNELSSFNYVASHDLQEPVRKILTFSELVREREAARLSEAGDNYLSRISAAAKRMQHLIEAFLNYSHINNLGNQFEPVDLNLVMRDVHNIFLDQLEEMKGTFKWDDLPQIIGVRIQLQQLFVNLTGNALKYSREGVPPEIRITAGEVQGVKAETGNTARGGRYWRISFSDNGIGFESEFNEKIFDVFVRLHSKDKYEGTGIGLAICRKIVNSHKGFIRAEGRLGEGATFHIYLPIDPSHQD